MLGLVFNAAPGAVFAETVRHAVRGGYRPALRVQLGSLADDAMWAALGLLGVGLLLQADSLRMPIGAAGVVYLLWLSYDAWQASRTAFGAQIGSACANKNEQRSALRAGVLLSVTNPQNIAYWAALGSAMGAVGVHNPSASHDAVFFAGFMAASFVWTFVCAALVARLFRNATACWTQLTYRACAVAFLLLALSSLWELALYSAQRLSRTGPAEMSGAAPRRVVP